MVQNRKPVGQPSDPATGTTRREPPESAAGASTGAVASLDVEGALRRLPPFRVRLERGDGQWTARGIEYDVAAQHDTFVGVCASFARAFIGQATVNMHHGKAPMEDVPSVSPFRRPPRLPLGEGIAADPPLMATSAEVEELRRQVADVRRVVREEVALALDGLLAQQDAWYARNGGSIPKRGTDPWPDMRELRELLRKGEKREGTR